MGGLVLSIFSWFQKKSYSGIKKKLEQWEESVSQVNAVEEEAVKIIQYKTQTANRNNITRTMAYLDIYERNPELEWAFLAHLVSRNAGWNMTDLKGEWCTRLLSEKERESYFLFMERANWLIFQDAYPQLLLYEQAKKRQKPLFHLLSVFHVSRFMQAVWEDFWEHGNRALLTVSLIINEQNYIELRVIEQDQYSAPVFKDIKYFLEDLLDLCMIIIPAFSDEKLALYGKQVNSFPELHERIQLGKELYGILFSPDVLSRVLTWCRQTVHSGSRADYWPEMFDPTASAGMQKAYEKRVVDCKLKEGAPPIYSPHLEEAWRDCQHKPAMIGEWYHDDEAVLKLLSMKKTDIIPAEKEYCEVIQKTEAVILAKQLLTI